MQSENILHEYFSMASSLYVDLTGIKCDSFAKIFMKDIFRLHGFPMAIIYDRDTKFTSNFWKSLFADLGTKLNFSTAYHPQTDGKTKRRNQVLEEMLHMYIINKPTKWDYYLHLV